MEKYIALNLLCDPKKKKKNISDNDINNDINNESKNKIEEKKKNLYDLSNYQLELEKFIELIITKISIFNPYTKNDSYDVLLLALWHQYLFENNFNIK